MGVNVQARGWKTKSKTLEEVMKSTYKTEPQLIGYDETPIDVTDTNSMGQIMVQRDLGSKSDPEIRPILEVVDTYSPCVTPVGELLQSSPEGKLNETFKSQECSGDLLRTGNKKYILYFRSAQILVPLPLF